MNYQKPKIRVLIVDDSSFMRKALKGMLADDPEVEVSGMARDGAEAVEMVAELKPDVVTMDLEMPRMNGLEALKIIMEKNPLPVIMVSSLTEEGAKATFDAMALGAVDYISKHLDGLSVNIIKVKADLIARIKAVSKMRVKRQIHVAPPQPVAAGVRPKIESPMPTGKFVSQRVSLIAIGASTGGPMAVQKVLTALPADFPAGVIVIQHMPQAFTGPYAERLNSICNLRVKEAASGDLIKPGQIVIAPGGHQTKLKKKNALEIGVIVDDTPADSLYKPSVDVSFLSVAECFPGRAVGVVMTGMGSDGSIGAKSMKNTGSRIVAQDESSCVVYGMPKAIVDNGLADKIVSLDALAGEILNMV